MKPISKNINIELFVKSIESKGGTTMVWMGIFHKMCYKVGDKRLNKHSQTEMFLSLEAD